MLTGGCFCGRLRYEMAGAPYNSTLWPRSQLRRTGEPTRFRSSGKATRSFCDVTTASLDKPNQVTPADPTYARSRLEWIQLADGLPEFRQARSEG